MGGHPCQSVFSIKLLCKFIEITLRHGFSPINLLHISRTPFLKNTSGWLLLTNNKRHFLLTQRFHNLIFPCLLKRIELPLLIKRKKNCK